MDSESSTASSSNLTALEQYASFPFDDDDERVMRDKVIAGVFEDPEWLSDGESAHNLCVLC